MIALRKSLRGALLIVFLIACTVGSVRGENQMVSLPKRQFPIDDEFVDLEGWRCSNGSEYPGAKGSISAVAEGDQKMLRLDYEFSGGGNYVAAVGG